MGWKIIDIESNVRAKLFLQNLIIFKDLKKIQIPLSDIDTIVFDNTRTIMTTKLINELTKNNILVIVCDDKHLPSSLIVPFSGNYNSLKILEKQLNWNIKFKQYKWREIISHKIFNQIALLKYFDIEYDQNFFDGLLTSIEPFDITNREGHAAKIYWHIQYGIDFNRDLDNDINSMLNYGYAILYSYFARSIIKKGLDPRISIFHKSFSNHFALASDLMEEFRPLIDWFVLKLFKAKERISFVEAKERILNLFNLKCLINDKNYFIPQAIDIYIDSFVNQNKTPKVDFLYGSY